ncbi:MAG: hypothetical protein ABIJ21_05555 [Nanoarchaeota archaeon]
MQPKQEILHLIEHWKERVIHEDWNRTKKVEHLTRTVNKIRDIISHLPNDPRGTSAKSHLKLAEGAILAENFRDATMMDLFVKAYDSL